MTESVEGGVTTSDYAYDDNGQTALKDGRSYGYDVRNRLSTVTEGATTLQTNAYDPFGRRIWKENSSGQKTFFIYADEGLIAEADGTGAVTQSYGWAPDGLWGTDPVYTRTPSQGYAYYLNDHLGTPQRLIQGNGAVVWSADYEAFGEALVSVNVMSNNLRFPGQYYDGETGAHYNYFRDYDPGLGRYLQSDPIGLAGGLNTYGYVDLNPLKYFDSLGLLSSEECKKLLADIEREKRILSKLEDMSANYREEGDKVDQSLMEVYESYGLSPDAVSDGSRSESFYDERSETFQDVVNEMEDNGWLWIYAATGNFFVPIFKSVGELTWKEAYVRTHAKNEWARGKYVLGQIEKVYEEECSLSCEFDE